MANAGPDTNGSQFFIMDHDYPLPASSYTIFGDLRDGQDVVKAIVNSPRDDQDKPNETVTINKITIEEK